MGRFLRRSCGHGGQVYLPSERGYGCHHRRVRLHGNAVGRCWRTLHHRQEFAHRRAGSHEPQPRYQRHRALHEPHRRGLQPHPERHAGRGRHLRCSPRNALRLRILLERRGKRRHLRGSRQRGTQRTALSERTGRDRLSLSRCQQRLRHQRPVDGFYGQLLAQSVAHHGGSPRRVVCREPWRGRAGVVRLRGQQVQIPFSAWFSWSARWRDDVCRMEGALITAYQCRHRPRRQHHPPHRSPHRLHLHHRSAPRHHHADQPRVVDQRTHLYRGRESHLSVLHGARPGRATEIAH